MDHPSVTRPALLAALALALVLPGLDRHGFWFDEAHTARLAALDWPRLLDAAQRDIHPPGWPILAGLLSSLPIPAEWALRLPAALAFAGLVAMVGARSWWAGLALVLYGPLVEQATQGRPYVLLALGLVGVARLVEGRGWGWCGLLVAGVASLHALGAALGAATLLATVPFARPHRRDLVWLLAPPLLVCAAWLPRFLTTATAYTRAPWYPTSSAADWWIVTDAGGGALAALFVVIGAALDRNLRSLLPGAFVALLLAAAESAGLGVELRKTGIVVLPLLLGGLGASRGARIAAIAGTAALGAASVRMPDRPDLRAAEAAVAELAEPLPVIAVFASEAAWYLRSPAPLPSYREPAPIAARIAEVLRTHPVACVVSVALPGTFPSEDLLAPGQRTVLLADVTGLDVRVVGTERCDPRTVGGRWHRRVDHP